MRAVGIAMTLLSAAPLHSPGSSMDGWHVIGFLMLVGGFVALGMGAIYGVAGSEVLIPATLLIDRVRTISDPRASSIYFCLWMRR
jgi:hypothetical protein